MDQKPGYVNVIKTSVERRYYHKVVSTKVIHISKYEKKEEN